MFKKSLLIIVAISIMLSILCFKSISYAGNGNGGNRHGNNIRVQSGNAVIKLSIPDVIFLGNPNIYYYKRSKYNRPHYNPNRNYKYYYRFRKMDDHRIRYYKRVER